MRKLSASLVVAGGLLSLASANAQLAHRYTFTTNGADSVGGANGTLAGFATISGGMLTTTGAAGDNLTLPSSVGTGITGSFSIETYVTRNETGGNFSTLFSFASDQNDFVLLNPDRSGSGTSGNLKQVGINGGNEFNVKNGVAFTQGIEQQVVLTYTAGTGAANLYLNGSLAGTGTFGTGFNFQAVSSGAFDGIGGNAPFTTDQTFNGMTDDFRIYSQALTATQVSTLYGAAGQPNLTNAQIAADVVPEPSVWTTVLVGVGALLGLQRFRRSLA